MRSFTFDDVNTDGLIEDEPITTSTIQRQQFNGTGQQFDLLGFLASHGIQHKGGVAYQGGTKYLLEECPFDSSHKSPDSFVMQQANGALVFHCSHNSCQNNHWREFRQMFEPGCYTDTTSRHNPNKHRETKGFRRQTEHSDKQQLEFRPFPVDQLPMPLNTIVERFAKAIGCDESFVALPALAMLASSISSTRRLTIKRGWHVPPMLWTVNVGYSGSMKSPALTSVLKPLRNRQRKAMEVYAQCMKQYELELALFKVDQSKWEKKAEGDPPIKPEPPTAERCIIDNATVEAILPILESNPKHPCEAKDELAGWFASFDCYKSGGKGGDESFWLSAFNGDPYVNDRKTGLRTTIYLSYVCLSVTGGIQPDILKRHLNAERMESGLASRLLMTFPPQRPKVWNDNEIDATTEALLESLFNKMYSLDFEVDADGRLNPKYVGMSTDAKQLFIEYYNRHNVEQAELRGDLAAAWSKLEQYAARIALVLHYVRWAAGDFTLANDNQVDATTMEMAINLTEWFKHEAKRIYQMLHESDEDKELRRLAEWIQRKGGRITARDLQRNDGRRYATAEEAEQALEELVKHRYGTWEPLPTTSQGGRPSREFVLSSVQSADTTYAKHGNG